MVFQNIGVIELRMDLSLRDGSIEVLFCFFECGARFEFDDLDCIMFSIIFEEGLMNLCESARSDKSEVLKIVCESLG